MNDRRGNFTFNVTWAPVFAFTLIGLKVWGGLDWPWWLVLTPLGLLAIWSMVPDSWSGR